MNCPRCKRLVAADRKRFCGHCGAKLQPRRFNVRQPWLNALGALAGLVVVISLFSTLQPNAPSSRETHAPSAAAPSTAATENPEVARSHAYFKRGQEAARRGLCANNDLMGDSTTNSFANDPDGKAWIAGGDSAEDLLRWS
jgi:hypothetical protein